MCGIVRPAGSDSDLVVTPLQAASMPPAMPPSITVGSEPNKGNSPPSGDAPKQPAHHQSPSNNKDIPTIDLASEADVDDDLQKAIALSLQEQQEVVPAVPGVSAEDQEVSRALEASLKESRPQATVDQLNPGDRKRVAGSPVGLKNIGNSCWFNVVIQPLFHIPGVRDLILKFNPCTVETEDTEISKDCQPKLVLMLRPLFSLLLASERKYIDPTSAVNFFQGQEMRKNAQQDVCEFIHKLLERLENEFQYVLRQEGIEKESSECHVSKDANFGNPIMKLFYGQSRKEMSEEDGGPKQETFGQYPLHVMNYKNIHQSILASMAGGIPDMTKDVVEPVQQDTWFKMLPPVLIFSLSRYEYSLEKQRAEKVHNKFEFPDFLYMDRYMEINKKNIKEKHIKVARLREELNSLNKTLDKYQKYGSGEGKYPLSDILKYTLEFAQSTIKSEEASSSVASPFKMEVDNIESCDNTDVEMSEEPEIKQDTESSNSNNPESSNDEPETKFQPINEDRPTPVTTPATIIEQSPMRIPSPSKKMRVMPPAPGSLNASELSVLQNCLPRWQKQVEAQVDELQRGIADLEEQLDKMYDEPFLKRIPYKLHAVVVHEGQASGGHYWVYIYNRVHKIWIKFNDIQVCDSKWSELLQDSLGGQNNASAYCLMYIDESRYNILFPEPMQNIENIFADMPLDLQEFVKSENHDFKREIQEWEKKQQQEAAVVAAGPISAAAGPSTTNTDAAIGSGEQENAVPATAPNSPDIISIEEEDAKFFIDIQTIFSVSVKKLLESDDSRSFNVFLVKEFGRMKSFADNKLDPLAEPSLLDLGVYLLKNVEKAEILVRWYCCDVIWQTVFQSEVSARIEQITLETKHHLYQIHEQYQKSHSQLYRGWRRHYRNFINCAWCLVCGHKKYRDKKYEHALVILMHAVHLHNQIETTVPSGPCKTLDVQVLSKCRRFCLIDLNERLVSAFRAATTEEQAYEVTESVAVYIVPALFQLKAISTPGDSIAIDKIQSSWCQFLECNLDSPSMGRLEQILEGVLNSNLDGKIERQIVQLPPLPGTLSLYKQYVDLKKAILIVPDKTTHPSDL